LLRTRNRKTKKRNEPRGGGDFFDGRHRFNFRQS
jgi:hypothetical protein